jgi:hypothetical protein
MHSVCSIPRENRPMVVQLLVINFFNIQVAVKKSYQRAN